MGPFWRERLIIRIRRALRIGRIKEPGPTWRDRLAIGFKRLLRRDIYLCHSCRWNWRSSCNDPRWPQATWCREYERWSR